MMNEGEWKHTLSGRFTPPTTAVAIPAALFLAKSSSCFASSALRSKNELALTPAAFALFFGCHSCEDEVCALEQGGPG